MTTTENTSTVWLVFEQVPYEGEHLYGVYTTKEAAEKRRDTMQSVHGSKYSKWVIHEANLDKEYLPF